MKNTLLLVTFMLISTVLRAETDLVVFTGFSQVSFDIEEDQSADGIDISDDFSTIRLGFGAYRKSEGKSSWGIVIEMDRATGRDFDQGSGQLLGIRPINWKYQWSESVSTQLFFGAARYSWEQDANGYYAGATMDYTLSDIPLILSLEAKIYRDLNYDTSNGDLFITGPSLGLNIGYLF